jgi:hypothetical protein
LFKTSQLDEGTISIASETEVVFFGTVKDAIQRLLSNDKRSVRSMFLP